MSRAYWKQLSTILTILTNSFTYARQITTLHSNAFDLMFINKTTMDAQAQGENGLLILSKRIPKLTYQQQLLTKLCWSRINLAPKQLMETRFFCNISKVCLKFYFDECLSDLNCSHTESWSSLRWEHFSLNMASLHFTFHQSIFSLSHVFVWKLYARSASPLLSL